MFLDRSLLWSVGYVPFHYSRRSLEQYVEPLCLDALQEFFCETGMPACGDLCQELTCKKFICQELAVVCNEFFASTIVDDLQDPNFSLRLYISAMVGIASTDPVMQEFSRLLETARDCARAPPLCASPSPSAGHCDSDSRRYMENGNFDLPHPAIAEEFNASLTMYEAALAVSEERFVRRWWLLVSLFSGAFAYGALTSAFMLCTLTEPSVQYYSLNEFYQQTGLITLLFSTLGYSLVGILIYLAQNQKLMLYSAFFSFQALATFVILFYPTVFTPMPVKKVAPKQDKSPANVPTSCIGDCANALGRLWLHKDFLVGYNGKYEWPYLVAWEVFENYVQIRLCFDLATDTASWIASILVVAITINIMVTAVMLTWPDRRLETHYAFFDMFTDLFYLGYNLVTNNTADNFRRWFAIAYPIYALTTRVYFILLRFQRRYILRRDSNIQALSGSSILASVELGVRTQHILNKAPLEKKANRRAPVIVKSTLPKVVTSYGVESLAIRAAVITSAWALAASFFGYYFSRVVNQQQACEGLFGASIWANVPGRFRIFFSNGFFQSTNCGLEFITELNLSTLGLRELPPSFCELTSLVELDVSNNQLTQFPDCMSLVFASLNSLNAANNSLVDLSHVLVAAFNHSRDSLSLDFSNNPIETSLDWFNTSLTEIPPIVFQHEAFSHLEQLNFSHNKLNVIPQEVASLNKLRILDVSANELSSFPVIDHQSLERLYLNDNQLQTLTFSWYPRLAHLEANNNLLQQFTLSREMWREFVPSSNTSKYWDACADISIEILVQGNPLEEYSLYSVGIYRLPDFLFQFEKLRVLNLQFLHELHCAQGRFDAFPFLESIEFYDHYSFDLAHFPITLWRRESLREVIVSVGYGDERNSGLINFAEMQWPNVEILLIAPRIWQTNDQMSFFECLTGVCGENYTMIFDTKANFTSIGNLPSLKIFAIGTLPDSVMALRMLFAMNISEAANEMLRLLADLRNASLQQFYFQNTHLEVPDQLNNAEYTTLPLSEVVGQLEATNPDWNCDEAYCGLTCPGHSDAFIEVDLQGSVAGDTGWLNMTMDETWTLCHFIFLGGPFVLQFELVYVQLDKLVRRNPNWICVPGKAGLFFDTTYTPGNFSSPIGVYTEDIICGTSNSYLIDTIEMVLGTVASPVQFFSNTTKIDVLSGYSSWEEKNGFAIKYTVVEIL